VNAFAGRIDFVRRQLTALQREVDELRRIDGAEA